MHLGWDVIAPFLLATIVLSITPGPATALVIRQSALYGVRHTLPVIAGVELGAYVWALLAALGVAGIVAASPTAFTVLKIVGALVLLWLGIAAWRASFKPEVEVADPETAPSARRGFWIGAATNLANPKLMVFCLAFFPQFIPAGSNVLAVTAVLAGITVVVDVIYFLTLAILVNRARTFFARRKVRVTLDRTAGSVFIALAARMATLTR